MTARSRTDVTATAVEQQPIRYQPPAVEWNGLTVTDLFCGAGGSSSGLREAGYRVVIAANHWALAIESHQINHPETDHSQANISQVNPAHFPTTRVLWESPECTNHSIAKGVKRQRQQDQALFEIDGTRPHPDEAANRRQSLRRCSTSVTRSARRSTSTRGAAVSRSRAAPASSGWCRGSRKEQSSKF